MTTKTTVTFSITPNPTPMAEADRLAAFEHLGFGTLFTDHMAMIKWSEGKGWHDATIGPRQPFQIDPAASVLHYAQEIFEGMKAYRGADGKITLFRPEENAHRFNLSAQRMAMPQIEAADFLNAVEALIKIDAKWVPDAPGSLYLRPFMFASETFLGVRPSKEYIFCVIASPVGPYFKGGSKPVSIWASQTYTRAAVGGTGTAKCGGNYAASLLAQAEASQHGCDQVVFFDAVERRWIEELGGMNIFFAFKDGSVITTPLGTILPGITRKSLLQLAKDDGIAITEQPYSFQDLQADAASGKLVEAFACGTAAVVAGIGRVKHEGGEIVIGDGQTGALTNKLRDKLVGIQQGTQADPYAWVYPVEV